MKKNNKKTKKTKTEYIIILQMCTEKWSATDRMFCHLGPFFPFHPAKNPKNQNFEIKKKLPGDIIILYMCTINENHMMHGSGDMDRQNCL